MNALVITVAGIGSRFNLDLPSPCLKAIYYRDDYTKSLLYQILLKSDSFGKIIIVGGYRYDDLLVFVNSLPIKLKSRILCIYNEHYNDYGSCYSLYLGLSALKTTALDNIVFIEGDLYVDSESWNSIIESPHDVITINKLPIVANKSVALYIDLSKHLHYIYNINHSSLEIKEPFISILNSAQVWKFQDVFWLFEVISSLNYEELSGTNLEIIEKYFSKFTIDDICIIPILDWINCNTVNDYEQMLEYLDNEGYEI